ncbi:NACHT domain-containing protein [Streptomyces zaomyceticus]|uniref:NACHT domain-containing protein n=1 Tax=Streptomyces zaomyceticus TaxID=68286 RepID=UPI00378D97B6
MPDYDLTRLGDRAFEQLVVSLALQELGPGVGVFGDGKDGGREATFDGTINWSATVTSPAGSRDIWTGYTVLQAKYQVKPKPTPYDNAVWLQQQLKSEIAGWSKAAKLRSRSRLPKYLIFVTNIDLSAVAKVGGIDRVTAAVKKELEDAAGEGGGLDVQDFRIWHADQIRSMLDAHQAVRWAFPGLLTAGDVLAKLGHGAVSLGNLDVQDPLRQELLKSLTADRWIRLGQAGGSGDAKLWLDDIAIDLPAVVDGSHSSTVQAVNHVLEVGNTVLRPRQIDRYQKPHMVLVGGPGQGKSTLSQLIAQAYRTAMLSDADVAPGAQVILEGTREALKRLDIAVPGNRRWPVRIDLAKYAEELGSGRDTSLLRWIAQHLSKRTTDTVHPTILRDWLRVWPWALILDGLDEVPSQLSRRAVYEKVNELLTDAEDLDSDLLIVVTTRPTGYDERFPEEQFRHLRLQRVPPEKAAAFAERIIDKRFPDDEDMRLKVIGRMADAARDPITVRLMETPLQVTIMSLIVEKYPNLPPDRFTLFDLYFRTVSDREIAKDIPDARFLSQNNSQIDKLHEQVGLRLQVDSETADGADAHMSHPVLHDLAAALMQARGFEEDDASARATAIVKAATQRLVLLVPRDTGVGFDIRTLQELMAARAIIEGDDRQVISRLRTIAHHPHWRNTWLLAVGALLKRSDRFERLILELLQNLDSEPRRLKDRYPTSPMLAAEILEDNLASGRPRFERGLVACLLTSLDRPPVNPRRIADGILCTPSAYRKTVFEQLGSAKTSGPARRAAAALVLDAMEGATFDQGRLNSIKITTLKLGLTELEKQTLHRWGHSSLGEGAEPVEVDSQVDLADYLKSAVEITGLDSEETELLECGIESLRGFEFQISGSDPGTAISSIVNHDSAEPLARALENETLATAVGMALNAIPGSHWVIEAIIGGLLKPIQDRIPVGRELLASMEESQDLF